MKSFLLNKYNKPSIQWGLLPDDTFFIGVVPEGYSLAVAPGKYIVVDVDNKSEQKNGFKHIPKYSIFKKVIYKLFKINKKSIFDQLEETFNYKTKSGKGKHYWLLYTGNKTLINRASKYHIDLRIGEKNGNAGGYVKYHHNVDIRKCEHLIKETSKDLNLWLEKLFSNE